jgi:hypothetical protein
MSALYSRVGSICISVHIIRSGCQRDLRYWIDAQVLICIAHHAQAVNNGVEVHTKNYYRKALSLTVRPPGSL